MIYIFEEWHDYDNGGMNVHEVNNKAELKEFFRKRLIGERISDAQDILDKFRVVEGTELSVTMEEIVKDFTVSVS